MQSVQQHAVAVRPMSHASPLPFQHDWQLSGVLETRTLSICIELSQEQELAVRGSEPGSREA